MSKGFSSNSEQRWTQWFDRDGYFVITRRSPRERIMREIETGTAITGHGRTKYAAISPVTSYREAGRTGKRIGFIDRLKATGRNVVTLDLKTRLICYDPNRVLPERVRKEIAVAFANRLIGRKVVVAPDVKYY